MRRQIIVLAVAVVAAILIFGSLLPRIAVHGYDGLESYVHRIESGYTNAIATPDFPDTSITWDPPVQSWNPFDDPLGIHIDIDQPTVLKYELMDTIEREERTTMSGQDWLVTKTWIVQIAHLQQYVHIYTAGKGDIPLVNVRVWIQLHENPYTVFTGPDESEAYILNVWNLEQVQKSGGYAEVSPAAKGIDFHPSPITTESVPQWIIESGYTGALTNFKDIEYPIDIVHLERGFFLETDLEWYVGIDVLLFGYWEQTKQFHDPGYDPPTLFDWLFDFFGNIWAALVTPLGVIVIIVAMIATVVLVIRAPKGWLLMFGMVIVWVAAFLALGMMGASVILT